MYLYRPGHNRICPFPVTVWKYVDFIYLLSFSQRMIVTNLLKNENEGNCPRFFGDSNEDD